MCGYVDQAMQQPTTFTYVNGRGNGERVRFVLAGASVDFTEHNITTREERDALIANGRAVAGLLPILTIDGLDLVQSWSMIRYIARTRNLEPESSSDKVKADMFTECVRDFETMAGLVGYGWAPIDEHKKKVLEAVDKWFPRFESFVVGPFVFGDKPYYCDFVLLNSLLYVQEILTTASLKVYPKLTALNEHLCALPQIKAFMTSEKRHGLVDEEYKALCNKVFPR